MIEINDTSMALVLFEEAASKHAEATEQGDKCYAVNGLLKNGEWERFQRGRNYHAFIAWRK